MICTTAFSPSLERKSGLVIIKKTLRAIGEYEAHLDNGTEFHEYKLLEDHFPLKCYFATPYHSWERGSNENLNGLIRQYLPKGMCMSGITQAHCNYIAFKLNSRPRKRHGYRTPQEVYNADSR